MAISITPVRYVLLPPANLVTGYTVKAMQRKIARGDWQEGKVWRRVPDGRITIDLVGYEKSSDASRPRRPCRRTCCARGNSSPRKNRGDGRDL